jgi:hypothetical protein
MNVVRHIVTESRFESGLLERDSATPDAERNRPGLTAQPIDAESFAHQIPTTLVRRVYFDPTNDTTTGMWQYFGGQLTERKNEALRFALGLPRDGSVLETMVASDDPWGTDRTVVEAYVRWLREGGLAPADYLVMLPEIIENVRQLYQVVNQQGRARAQAMNDEYIFRPSRRLERRMLNNAFGPRACETCNVDWSLAGDAAAKSRFERVMDEKRAAILAVVDAYIETVENVSNLNVTTGIPHSTREQREVALAPLRTRLDELTNMNYEIVFSETIGNILESLGLLKGVLDEIFAMATARVKELVLARLHEYLDEYVAEYQRLREQIVAQLDEQVLRALEELQARIVELRETIREESKRALLDRLALDLEAGEEAFKSFPSSVLWMNTYNSVAGVLTRQGVADPGLGTSGFWAGPVSFDASYQVEYNQLALCDSLRTAFYPCGTSAGEILQPDYRTCTEIPGAHGVLDPPTECHVHDPTSFAEAPTAEDCRRSTLEAHIAPHSQRIHDYDETLGSYTQAFPPSILEADDQPVCNSGVVESFPLSYGPKSDSASGGGGPATMPTACTVGRGPAPVAPLGLLLMLVVLARVGVRRR